MSVEQVFDPNSHWGGIVGGARWTQGVITYSFPDSSQFYPTSIDDTANALVDGFSELNDTQISSVERILDEISSFSNIQFLELDEQLDLGYSPPTPPTMRFGNTSSDILNSAGAFTPGNYGTPGDHAGDSWYRTNGNYNSPEIGNFGYSAGFQHEIGHALGLVHGHVETVFGSLGIHQGVNVNTNEFSVMTYREYDGDNIAGSQTEDGGHPQSYMMLDIAALQYLYGADFSVTGNVWSGDTVYTFSQSTGEMFINGIGQGTPTENRVFRTIWDGHGNDTYDFRNYLGNLTISLSAGEWSTLDLNQLSDLNGGDRNFFDGSMAMGNIANALLFEGDTRSLIENAIGGSGDDSISGNQVDNNLDGGFGNDTLNGASGNDTLTGGSGNDTLIGGEGEDTAVYYGGSGDYSVSVDSEGNIEVVSHSSLDAGTDVLSGIETLSFGQFYTSINIISFNNGSRPVYWNGDFWIIGDEGDNYTSVGDGNDTVWGNGGNDLILFSSGGNTVAYGGTGNDRFNIDEPNRTFYSGDTEATVFGEDGDDHVQIRGVGSIVHYDGGEGHDTAYVDQSQQTVGEIYDLTSPHAIELANGSSFVNVEEFTSLHSGSGDDTYIRLMATDAGQHVWEAGAGFDTFIFDASNFNSPSTDSSGLNVNFSTNNGNWITVITAPGGTYDPSRIQLFDVEVFDLTLSVGNDRGYGGDFNDTIYGGLGNDELSGGGGNDDLAGGKNDDTLSGGDGSDLLVGGRGSDWLSGGDEGDFLYGGKGEDTLEGGEGNDRLRGNNKKDLLEGGAGSDVLIGGSGYDTLDGGEGDDILRGGSHADVFQFRIGGDQDIIEDFSNNKDTLHLFLDEALWRQKFSVSGAISEFASVVDENVVFDFGNGDTLTIEGHSKLGWLQNDVELFYLGMN